MLQHYAVQIIGRFQQVDGKLGPWPARGALPGIESEGA